jgi:hypothetical protein
LASVPHPKESCDYQRQNKSLNPNRHVATHILSHPWDIFNRWISASRLLSKCASHTFGANGRKIVLVIKAFS